MSHTVQMLTALAEHLRPHAEASPEPARTGYLRIIECHTGYHECPDELQRPVQVFEYECPTLLALAGVLGVRYESGISQAT